MASVPANRYWIFFTLALGGCLVDLVTKYLAFGALGMPGGRTWWVVPGFFGFQTSLNEGALFGVLQGQVWLFAVLSVFAAIGILYWLFVAGGAEDRLLTTALGCIMGGILGNLYDRAGFHGLMWHFPHDRFGKPVYAVRDWILIEFRNWTWPNFNIADSLLVCGVAVLMWHAWVHGEPSRVAEARQERN